MLNGIDAVTFCRFLGLKLCTALAAEFVGGFIDIPARRARSRRRLALNQGNAARPTEPVLWFIFTAADMANHKIALENTLLSFNDQQRLLHEMAIWSHALPA